MSNLQEKDVKPSAKEMESYSSSDEGNYDDPPSYEQVSAMKGKRFDFNYGSFPWRNVTIQESTSNNVDYFADISRYSRSSPDITLHTHVANGPVLGQARFHSMSRSIKCGIGSNDLAMDWVEVHRSGPLLPSYQFQHNGKSFSLVRTGDAKDGAGGLKMLASNYKVVNEVSGEVVAIYNSQSAPGKRRGTLTFKSNLSRDLEMLIILTVLSVRETRKRRAQYAAAAGASAGAA